jgi:hypothetical protein
MMKPKPLLILLTISFSALLWVPACRHEADISSFPDVCFDKEILPIFLNNCSITGCHTGNGEEMKLSDYTSIMRGIKAGKPASSSIYKAITTTFGEGQMPPGQPITLENRTLIRVWIEQGASNTSCLPVAGH